MSTRAVPFHCPYCGDEGLFPHEAEEGSSHGGWECRSCLRTFKVTMTGHLPRPSTASSQGGAR